MSRVGLDHQWEGFRGRFPVEEVSPVGVASDPSQSPSRSSYGFQSLDSPSEPGSCVHQFLAADLLEYISYSFWCSKSSHQTDLQSQSHLGPED